VKQFGRALDVENTYNVYQRLALRWSDEKRVWQLEEYLHPQFDLLLALFRVFCPQRFELGYVQVRFFHVLAASASNLSLAYDEFTVHIPGSFQMRPN